MENINIIGSNIWRRRRALEGSYIWIWTGEGDIDKRGEESGVLKEKLGVCDITEAKSWTIQEEQAVVLKG